MQHFARLLDELSTEHGRTGKIALLTHYFRTTPDPDRGWALAALTDGVPLRIPFRRVLAGLMSSRIDPYLYKLSRDFVGDTAETVALLWPDQQGHDNRAGMASLDAIVTALQGCSPPMLDRTVGGLLDIASPTERWALLKFIGGALRVGVSARLAKTGLAQAFAKDVDDIEEVWHALKPPYEPLFAWLTARAPRPVTDGAPVFRPLMLANPIEPQDWPHLQPGDFAAEWKWDGIRVQIAAVPDAVRMFSRTGEDIAQAFPEIAQAYAGQNATLDGELLIVRDGSVGSFNELQQRLNRKSVTPRLLADFPAHVRLYDLLLTDGQDLRGLPFHERRQRLDVWYEAAAVPRTDLSPLIEFTSFDELHALHASARASAIEGLMLKRKASAYLPGRPKGHWFKWKRTALTVDCVLMYAQRGSGKRSSFYSDYTFGVWRDQADGTRSLVPVGKAYSGFTDVELKQLDSFIRQNTTETYGPVRAVKAEIVFEIAFDAVHASGRHKSGVAMRFPRIHRIRWDKPAVEADTLAAVTALMAGSASED